MRAAGVVLERFAEEVGPSGPVAVAGGRTRWELGGPVDGSARVLAVPAGIVEHAPEEMTVRVLAGTTVEELHAELAVHGQRTALPERGGTVGGALAVGENDLRVLGRGRVRDAALQLRYVSAEGRVITAGGPTVKNVSGYDLPRLLVGSLGTLGCFGEAILRTRPVGQVERWLAAPGADPFAVLGALYRPSAVLWDGDRTWVHLEGYVPDVAEQQAAVQALGPFVEVDGPPDLPPHRWTVRPSELRSATAGLAGPFVGVIGVGLLHASEPQPEVPGTGSQPIDSVRSRVKQEFDPVDRLNPGRRPGCGEAR